MSRAVRMGLGSFFLLLLALGVMAVPDTFSSTTLDAKGFQANQPYFGAGAQGSVNGFTGNLVLSETDLSILGRGLDLSITRRYNSNIWVNAKPLALTGAPEKDELLKPSWLGYGWDLHFGRIKIVRSDCVNTVGENQRLSVEWGDGSTEDIIAVDTTIPPGQRPVAQYILSDFSRVAKYNANRYYQWYVITKPDGTKYIFTHHVDLDAPGAPCVGGGTNPWSDATASNTVYNQYRYVGIYLSRIEDVNGNYISFDYYGSTDISGEMSPANDAERYEGCYWHYPLTRGSPYVSRITDTYGRTFDFAITNPATQAARLNYITYTNVNGKTAFLDFIYTNDPGAPTSTFSCTLLTGQCDTTKFLVAVAHRIDDNSNGLPDDAIAFPPTKYTYDSSGQLQSVETAHDANLASSTYYGSRTTYQYGNIEVLWDSNVCTSPGDECHAFRRVVRAVTVNEGSGAYPALTTFYWYGACPDGGCIVGGSVLSTNTLPMGYVYAEIPTTFGASEGPFVGYTGTSDADIAAFYAGPALLPSSWAAPFSSTLMHYLSLPPHPPAANVQNYKDGVTLATYTYDEPIGDLFPSLTAAPSSPSPRTATVSFYSPQYLGKARHYVRGSSAYVDHPAYRLRNWATLQFARDDHGGQRYTYSKTDTWDKFGNPTQTTDFGEVAGSAIANFDFSAGCKGPGGSFVLNFLSWGSCHFEGSLTGNTAYTDQGGFDIKHDWNADGVDEDKTIAKTRYLHEDDPRYEGKAEPITPVTAYPPTECTSSGSLNLPDQLCRELPVPYLGTTFQRITLPTTVEVYSGSDSAEQNKVSETQYRYDTTPLLYEASVTGVYDSGHHRGVAYVGWPDFMDTDTACFPPTVSCDVRDDETPHLVSLRGLPTEVRTMVKSSPGSVPSHAVSEAYFDVAGRAILTRTPYWAEDMAWWESENFVPSVYEREGADETLTSYGGWSSNLLYCLPGGTWDVQEYWLPRGESRTCSVAHTNNPHNNNRCTPLYQDPPPSGDGQGLYPYPTATVGKVSPEIVLRRPFYMAFPFIGYNVDGDGGGPAPAYGVGPPQGQLPNLDERQTLQQPADVKTGRRYSDHTGAVLAQWLEGPGVGISQIEGDDDGFYQYTQYVYDDLGRLSQVLTRVPPGSVDSPVDTANPLTTIAYTDANRPRKATVTARHCRTGDTGCLDGVTTLSPTTYLYDGLGRNYASYIQDTAANGGGYIYTFIEYDAKGNVKKTYRPFKLTSIVEAPSAIKSAAEAQANLEYGSVDERDFADRVTLASTMKTGSTTPVVPQTQTKYGIDWTAATDPEQTWTKTVTDTKGKPLQVISGVTGVTDPTLITAAPDGSGTKKVVTFLYDAFGQPAKTTVTGYQSTGPTQFITAMAYTNIGQLIFQNSPDAGYVSTDYNAAGRVTATYRATGADAYLTYDGMSRPIINSAERYRYVNGRLQRSSNQVRYTYDETTEGEIANGLFGLVRVTTLADSMGTTSYRYDARGRLVREVRDTVPNLQRKVTYYAYNWDGTLRYLKTWVGTDIYSSTDAHFTVYYYDALGRLKKMAYFRGPSGTAVGPGMAVVSLVDTLTYNPHGSVLSLLLNNNAGQAVTRTYTYQERDVDLLETIAARKGSAEYLDVKFDYDDNGNMLALYDDVGKNQPTPPQVAAFGYDALNRLLTSTDITSGNAYLGSDTTYTYDDLGDRQTETRRDAGGATTLAQTLVYDTAIYSSGSQTITSGTSRLIEDKDWFYDYDHAGNLIAKRLKFRDSTMDAAASLYAQSPPAFAASPWAGWYSLTPSLMRVTMTEGQGGVWAVALQVKGQSGRNQVNAMQRFKVEPFRAYTVRGKIKVNSTTTAAYGVLATQCFNYDALIAGAGACGTDNFGTTDFGPDDRRVGPLQPGNAWTYPANTWHEFAFTIMPNNPSASHVQISCFLFGNGVSTGPEDAVWCDDITITPDRTTYRYTARNQLAEVRWGDNCVKHYYDGLGQRIRKDSLIDGAQTRTDYAYVSGQLARKTATTPTDVQCGTVCGNGIVEEGEECDGANVQGALCRDFDIDLVGPAGCTSGNPEPADNCRITYDTCANRPACGNGILEAGEQCEFQGFNCRYEDAVFLCDGYGDGTGCDVNTDVTPPRWECRTAFNNQIYNLDYFSNLDTRMRQATHSQILELIGYTGKGTCFAYNKRYDVGNLETTINSQNFYGCQFPREDGKAGCTIKFWDYPSPCKCHEFCGCGGFSSPVFSKCYGSQCDWPPDFPPIPSDCPDVPGSGSGSPFYRVKLDDALPPREDGPY